MINAPGMAWLLAAALAGSALGAGAANADEAQDALRAADDAAMAGQYEKAAGLYEQAGRSANAAVKLRAACGRAEVDRQTGDYRAGLARLEALGDAGRRQADWHAAMASLLAEVGEYEKAAEQARAALERTAGHARARWLLGQMLETIGDTDGAIAAYKLFNERMTGGRLPDRADDMTFLGRGFLRYSVLTRHAELVRRTKHVLTEVYQEAYEFVDGSYWPARQAAAELLLEKHNLEEAVDEFEKVLELNPNAADALVGLGRAALEDWKFEECEKRAAAALKANPRHVGARVLLADTRMTERRYADAAKAAAAALETNERSISALSVLAAAQLRMGDEAAHEKTVARVEKISPRCAALHHALGRWLSAGRQFADAESHFKKAIAFSPTWAEPQADLGQLYMETGEEHLARRTLEAAFALDSFNGHTDNLLKLLDQIDHFSRLETEHFIVKFDEMREGPVAPLFGEALERFHDEICRRFDTKPAARTIIELFPDHMGFSVRITGRPFIATVGACTGRVIALQAPRGRPPFGHFNWATVLRHEFTHTVTLAATENRIPHWMTEGLAVHEEPQGRAWRTKQLLSEATRAGRLFTLSTIDWGFMRPRRADDRELAYAQSEWMVEYITERFGEEKIAEMLKAFRDRRTQAEVFDQVLGVSEGAFSSAFAAHAAKQVKQWGLPEETIEEAEALAEELEKKKDDPALLARWAAALLAEGNVKDAEKAARDALERDADSAKALEVLAHILVGRMEQEANEAKRAEAVDEAEPIVRRLMKADADSAAGLKYLGYVEQARRNWSKAIEALERYRRRYPDDPASYRRLAGIYLVQEREEAALRELEQLAARVEDEPAVPRRIGDLYHKRGDIAAAVEWYRRALEIDPYDRAVYGGLGEAYLKEKDYAQARRAFETLCKLKPDEPEGWEGLARVADATGDREQAAKYQERARALGGG